jgi:hypothetical protein
MRARRFGWPAVRRVEVGAAAAVGTAAGLAAIAGDWRVFACFSAAALSIPSAWRLLSNPKTWVPLFFVCAWLLPPLPVPLGDSGPHPALVVAGVGLLLGVLRLDQWWLRANSLNGALGALVLAMALSIPSAVFYSGLTVAVGSAARLALFGISAYVFWSASQGPDRLSFGDARRVAALLFLTGTAAALFGCVDFFYQLPAPAGYGPQFVWLDSGVYRRAQGLFYEASTLGNFCAFFLVMIAVALVQRREERIVPTWALVAAAPVFGAALLASYSRASVIAVAVACATLGFLERRRWATWRALAALVTSAAAAAALVTTLFGEFARSWVARAWFTIENLSAVPDRVLSGRLESWSALADFARWHPWRTLLGIGYKTLPYGGADGRPIVADNMYFSMSVETGVLGILALLALNVAILAACRRALDDPERSFWARWMLCFWAGEVVQMLSGDILTYWRVLPAYFWVLAQTQPARKRHREGASVSPQ